MRKAIAIEFITLDNVMQAPGGPTEDMDGGFKYGGWTVPYFDEFAGKLMGEQMRMPFELLLGRKTYDIFSSYWPKHGGDWPGVNETKKHVASFGDFVPEWNNSSLLKGDATEAVRQLKAQDGPDLHVYGSGNLLQALFKADLVDELWLKIFPITLGTGKRLFAEGAMPAAFTLFESKVSPKGVIFASYRRAGDVKTGLF